MSHSVVIVAGGSGSRFGSDIPKQFLNLGGLPVIMQTLGVFYNFDPALELIVVLPESQQEYWTELCREHSFSIPHLVATGGRERFHSVKNGLLAMRPGGIVAIHDAVRPLVSPRTVKRCFEAAMESGNAIPVIMPVDSLREVDGDTSTVVPRANYRMVQTPQCFDKKDILNAFEQDYDAAFTDDASVAEKAGHTIHLVEGNRENIKITSPADLLIASALFKNNDFPDRFNWL